MRDAIEFMIDDFHERGVPAPVRRDAATPEMPGKATVVAGMRRTGKSWFCFQRIQELEASGIPRERLLYLNFEDDRLLPFEARDFQLVLDVFFARHPDLKAHECHFFLDEIHRIPGWEAFVRRVLDTERIRLWLTGSSAKLLSGEIATALRGRSLTAEIFPLGFREFLRFHREEDAAHPPYGSGRRAILRHATERYLRVGGFPEVQAVPENLWGTVLQGYVDTVILRDVVERHGVRNTPALRALIRAVLGSPGGRFSVNRFYGAMKSAGLHCDKNELYRFTEYLSDAFFLYPVEMHARSLKVRQVNPRKFYVVDTGLLQAMSYRMTQDRGALLENLVYMTLRRRRFRPDYYMTRTGREVDFVLAGPDDSRQLVQACWSLDDPATRERELRALREAQAELRAETATVVTWDEEGSADDGVRIIPVWRWLIDEPDAPAPLPPDTAEAG
ncbi:MAG: hypothetical protein A3K19_17040 [Lentisphaerae bacterium RIFOXYB12_FULL_65_16]|nr:MAG: hypothetical protein A3K18_18000 [Lentisphaerae bacterium RIFOXYA12_64_32]OGV88953.1 MAG: hypothetical protein A3K19_17040 [Lentisphaerae bacterium RIFOXYB12_FULL_65_16]